LTTIAKAEAERNFTRGIVGPFEGIVGNPQEVRAGTEVIAVVLAVLAIFGAGWSFMP
jgi:hypothetical protein